MPNVFPSGRKYQTLDIGVLGYAESKKNRETSFPIKVSLYFNALKSGNTIICKLIISNILKENSDFKGVK